MELSPSPGFSYALQSPVTRTVELPQPAGLRSPYSCPSLQKRGWTHAGREHRPPLRTFRRCWGGVWSSSAPDRQPGRFLSLPLHAQTSAKAGTQTSSQCTSSTVRASALMVVPMLYAQPLELSPAGACISTLPAIDTTHPLPTAAPPPTPVPSCCAARSALWPRPQRDGAGITHQVRGALLVPVIQRLGPPSASEGPLLLPAE